VKLAHTMALVVPPVQDLKRRSQRSADGETTMYPTLIALREDRVLCVVTVPRMPLALACAPTLAIGLAPQALVLAAQVSLPERPEGEGLPAQEAGEGIAYHVMTRDRVAASAVQRYAPGPDGELLFGRPVKAAPDTSGLLDQLAGAMSHEPLDHARVAPKEAENLPPDRQPEFLPAAKGRLAIDAGATNTVRQKVGKAGGTVLYLAASPAQATELLGYGMPKELLLGA
jgi:hypothetical protein